jgi:hypothetical protein
VWVSRVDAKPSAKTWRRPLPEGSGSTEEIQGPELNTVAPSAPFWLGIQPPAPAKRLIAPCASRRVTMQSGVRPSGLGQPQTKAKSGVTRAASPRSRPMENWRLSTAGTWMRPDAGSQRASPPPTKSASRDPDPR